MSCLKRTTVNSSTLNLTFNLSCTERPERDTPAYCGGSLGTGQLCGVRDTCLPALADCVPPSVPGLVEWRGDEIPKCGGLIPPAEGSSDNYGQ